MAKALHSFDGTGRVRVPAARSGLGPPSCSSRGWTALGRHYGATRTCRRVPAPRTLALGSTENEEVGSLEERHERDEKLKAAVGDFPESVTVSVTSLPSRNLRELVASTHINAPANMVWDTLTSYETLHEFIPGLAVNECVERTERGATLLQIGEANTAVGFRFKAKVLLKIEEHVNGVNEGHKFRRETEEGRVRDITFDQLEGDFREYEGTWKILGGDLEESCKLVYMLRVKPQPWLPVSLVMMKVSQEVKVNLACVRMQAEATKVQV
ncbi:polyketide cyclase domain-containing protein [Chloropicon primus]|uniref:Coenzyme Q-binding protein COQ10 START domain-containing protein n=1 Tax=Chloropicon primus TaxID=1764295 RepID=A0A5B8MBR2_9CHLO|nr:hypothetical protein A3770_01p02170 [Chloropicon primus]UPQ96916.1 polyketide cyclase domain-containing protein [Chloropicon primus]|eukprot:QDZ17699.1 hypothetical protein A3770_01p02170 [Chloropicon primus]